jgi:hypothetical protein
MSSILARMFGRRPESRGDVAYNDAMRVSGDLLRRMGESSSSTDAARAIMADVWAQNHNIPFIVTVYESVQEMKSGADQKPEKK